MYMNISGLRLGEILAIECFLSHFGYNSEIRGKHQNVVLRFDKTFNKKIDMDDDECEVLEIKVI